MWVKICLLLLCFALLPGDSSGQTFITGPLHENQLWELTGSPFIVQGEVWMDDGLSLVIEPGVVVLMEPGASFGVQIHCTVDVQGTAEAPILFSSNSASPQPGDYVGVYLGTVGNTTLAHCIIEYAERGLSLDVPLSVEQVEIRFCTDGLMAIVIQGEISGFEIHDNTRFGILCHELTAALIRDCKVTNNGLVGIQANLAYSEIGVDQCIVQGNGSDGIVATGDVTNCIISGNGGMGLILVGGITASHNTIIGNAGIGVGVRDVLPHESVQVNWCNIYDNGDYDFAVAWSCYVETVDATNNFWGTQDAGLISARILDAMDDPTLPSTVDYSPFEATVEIERTTWGGVKSMFR